MEKSINQTASKNNSFAPTHENLTLSRQGGGCMKKPIKYGRSLMSLLVILLVLVFIGMGCEKLDDTETNPQNTNQQDTIVAPTFPIANCIWDTIYTIQVSNELQNCLNFVFSENNNVMQNMNDTALFIINSMQQIMELQGYNGNSEVWQQIDWEKQSICGVRILTTSVSDKIQSCNLLKCNNLMQYNYEVTIEKCIDCWAAFGYHYFWGIYPQKINQENISLTVNILE
jgi:hypothetical protein